MGAAHRTGIRNIAMVKDNIQGMNATTDYAAPSAHSEIEELRHQVKDLTERYGTMAQDTFSAERRSAEDYARLAAIVDFSDDAIVSKDLNGIINSWNGGAERLFGYKAEEVIGKPITILIPPDRQSEEIEILGRIRRGERVDYFDTVRRRKDGSLVEISLTVSPIKTAHGTIAGASKMARDITDRRRAEEHAQRLAAIVEFQTTPSSAKT